MVAARVGLGAVGRIGCNLLGRGGRWEEGVYDVSVGLFGKVASV